MIAKLVRALFSPQPWDQCRRCNESLDPRDVDAVSEGVCLPCRLDPHRALAA